MTDCLVMLVVGVLMRLSVGMKNCAACLRVFGISSWLVLVDASCFAFVVVGELILIVDLTCDAMRCMAVGYDDR